MDTSPRALARYFGWALLIGGGLYAVSSMQSGSTVPEGTNVSALLEGLDQVAGLEDTSAVGQILVLNFWATWCGPCRQEAPILSKLHRSGVQVIGIATDDLPLATVARKARSLGMNYPVGVGSAVLMRRFKVQVVPTTYVIGPGGKVVYARAGFASAGALRKAIARARKSG